MSDRIFGHSGDFGDIVYALPAIRALGGGHLYLYDIPRRTAHGMSPERAACLIPLLEVQSYMRSVQYAVSPPGGRDSPLNQFRARLRGKEMSLVDGHLAVYDLPVSSGHRRWLEVPPAPVASVVFSRSARYHNGRFPWKEIHAKYAKGAVFVGTRAEHDVFEATVGAVPFKATRDLLEAAQVIAGSELFVGNQSCPAAIAEGLKHPMILEVCPACPNCNFHRMCKIHGTGPDMELPDLSGWAVSTGSPSTQTPLAGEQSPASVFLREASHEDATVV